MAKTTKQTTVEAPQQYLHAYERPDNRSLVAVCDLKPITMGDRVARYMRSPSLRDDLVFSDPDYDPDDFYDDEDRPMSPHEERYKHFNDRKKAKKAELDKKASEEAAEKLRLANEEFVKRVREIKADISPTK